MKYLVVNKYFDNGRTSAEIKEVDDNTEEYTRERKNYTEYGNVFDTYTRAAIFRNDILSHNRMKTYTIEEQNKIGKRIAEIFQLKMEPSYRIRHDKTHIDYYKTTWGSKTPIGLFNTVLKIAEDIEDGTFIND